MSDIQWILIILGSVCVAIQASMFFIAAGLLRDHPSSRVRMGLGWGLLGVVFLIAAALV